MHNLPFDQLTSEFDDYTNFGSKLESVNGNVSKIKEKSFPEVISLFKKLNIRGVIDALNNKNTEFDEGEYGLFAEAIKADFKNHPRIKISSPKFYTLTGKKSFYAIEALKGIRLLVFTKPRPAWDW